MPFLYHSMQMHSWCVSQGRGALKSFGRWAQLNDRHWQPGRHQRGAQSVHWAHRHVGRWSARRLPPRHRHRGGGKPCHQHNTGCARPPIRQHNQEVFSFHREKNVKSLLPTLNIDLAGRGELLAKSKEQLGWGRGVKEGAVQIRIPSATRHLWTCECIKSGGKISTSKTFVKSPEP